MRIADLFKQYFPNQSDQIELAEPLKRFTSLKVGGPADLIFYPRQPQQVVEAVALCKSNGVPYRVLGAGTNLLIDDAGYRGVIIYTPKFLTDYRIERPKADAGRVLLYAQAGVRMPGLIHFCCEQGLSGLEFAAGIPGTLGGILWMNAGTKAGEVRQIFHSMEILDDAGRLKTLTADAVHFTYRSCNLPNSVVILAGRLWLQEDASEQAKQAIVAEVNRVKSFRYNQPLQWPNCGSVFKNPEGDYAGRLIEKCKLKGLRIGGAMISEQHANFIINTGEASARDVLDLIERVQREVFEQCGVRLQTEVERLP